MLSRNDITAFIPKKNNTRKTSGARGPCRHFDEQSKFAREKLIRGCAERYLDNVAKNNGKSENDESMMESEKMDNEYTE